MFRTLTTGVTTPGLSGDLVLVSLHPAELVGLLEQAWNLRENNPASNLGQPDHRSDTPGIGVPTLPIPVTTPPSLTQPPPGPAAPFSSLLLRMGRAVAIALPGTPARTPGVGRDHLIYAYMIENTMIYEIFRRVVHELVHGEKLGPPRPDTQLWLRNTEELFYRDPPPFSIASLNSYVRPDLSATRRNAYYRMFGMDLNHGDNENKPYPYVRAEAANNEFVNTFEELLHEVWIGFTNRSTTSGANPTDDAKIEELARKLHDMLTTRRLFGNLSREEFFFVAMMSWFHLTVENDNQPIIRDLRAEGSSPEQRLFKIAQLVGLPAHGLSRSYFLIAPVISVVLNTIETGALNLPGAARAFYDPTIPPMIPGFNLANSMNTIATHWSVITGHDVKAGKVAVK